MYDVKVGDFVYLHYTPAVAGVVLAVHDMGNYDGKHVGGPRPKDITVKFLKGETKRLSTLGVSDYRALIADHRRKLSTHEARLKKLEELQA